MVAWKKRRSCLIFFEYDDKLDFVTVNIRYDGNMSNKFTSMTYIVGLLRAVILVTACWALLTFGKK